MTRIVCEIWDTGSGFIHVLLIFFVVYGALTHLYVDFSHVLIIIIK